MNWIRAESGLRLRVYLMICRESLSTSIWIMYFATDSILCLWLDNVLFQTPRYATPWPCCHLPPCPEHELEMATSQESRVRRFRHLTKLGGVTVDVFYKSASVLVSRDQPRGRRYPAIIRRNQTWQDIIKTFEFPSTESNIPTSRLADGSTLLRRWSHPEVQIILVNEELLMSKEATIDETFDTISFGVDFFMSTVMDPSPTPGSSTTGWKVRQADQVRPEMVKLGKRSSESFFIHYADGQYGWADMRFPTPCSRWVFSMQPTARYPGICSN